MFPTLSPGPSNMWVDVPMCSVTSVAEVCYSTSHLMVNKYLKGVVLDIGHQTSFSSEPVCLSLETVCNTFHSVLIVAEITGTRLAQVEGIC